ncbi:YcaO-like family protein [Paracoccus methylovorus]|uniref:YcaO-like family protein n=1 Tax=Paracoccus methylovorus TaxID=2812658 RepID=A0ABX7JNC7_9RHOB|nr:YcaO-like family protein [Paracoccus methylovorus]QRZ15776.1 YcaO-like family protein [Paracoccus methylovorus]
MAPAETVARVRPLMARMGITRVANVTGLDRIGLPVVMVCRPNARSLAVSQGKGLDMDAATASGLMEAAELYHAEHIEAPLKLGSLNELAHSHRMIDLGRLARVSDRFHRDLPMLWIQGRDLVSGEERWVPFECVRANYTLPPPPGSGCFLCSSNGLASGNTMAEATCHAICELIERDATTLWHQSPHERRAETGLDLESVADPACCAVLDRLQGAGFDVHAWQVASDLGVPAFFCLISDRRDRGAHHGIGAGAHPTRAIALLRALTEAAQVRCTYISGARDDLQPEEYGRHALDQKARAAAGLRASHRPMVNFAALDEFVSDDFAEDLDWLLARLRAVGIDEAVAVDLRKPGLDLPVVRVVIPGLEAPCDHPAWRPGPRAFAAARAAAP